MPGCQAASWRLIPFGWISSGPLNECGGKAEVLPMRNRCRTGVEPEYNRNTTEQQRTTTPPAPEYHAPNPHGPSTPRQPQPGSTRPDSWDLIRERIEDARRQRAARLAVYHREAGGSPEDGSGDANPGGVNAARLGRRCMVKLRSPDHLRMAAAASRTSTGRPFRRSDASFKPETNPGDLLVSTGWINHPSLPVFRIKSRVAFW